MPATRAAALALTALAWASPAPAQERPREEDLFGAPPAAEKEKPAPTPAGGRPGEAEVLSGKGAEAAEARVARRLGETENPLQIGGQLYLRLNAFGREGQDP